MGGWNDHQWHQFSPLCCPDNSADSAEPALCYCLLLVDSWNYTRTTASPLRTTNTKQTETLRFSTLWRQNMNFLASSCHLPWSSRCVLSCNSSHGFHSNCSLGGASSRNHTPDNPSSTWQGGRSAWKSGPTLMRLRRGKSQIPVCHQNTF